MVLPKFERLARELETFTERKIELEPLIASIRNQTISKEDLVKELQKARLGYFANKVLDDFYRDNPIEEEE